MRRRKAADRGRCRETPASCFYCSAKLADSHVHDHFPIPYRWGGNLTVCACRNCHILKDTAGLFSAAWTDCLIVFGSLWQKMEPRERILFARLWANFVEMGFRMGDWSNEAERLESPLSQGC